MNTFLFSCLRHTETNWYEYYTQRPFYNVPEHGSFITGIRAFQDSSIKWSNLDCRIEINCKLLAGADVLYCEALATAALQVHTAALTMTTTTTSNIGVVHCSEISITSYQAMRQSQRVKWIYWLLGVQQSVTNVKCIISRHNHFFFFNAYCVVVKKPSHPIYKESIW
jgi:hypothetical protein